MILKALYDYYYRVKDFSTEKRVPPYGYQLVPISFVIVIEEDGKFVRIEGPLEDKSYLLPREVGRTSGIEPNLLWDNAQYVFAHSKKQGAKDIERASKCNESFIKRIQEFAEQHPSQIGVNAIVKFYQKGCHLKIKDDNNWNKIIELCESSQTINFTFQLNHSLSLIPEYDSLGDVFFAENGESICLISGKKGVPVMLTGRSPIRGSQAKAYIVSFQESSGYDSYGKEKCYNSPIIQESEFAYVTALNHLTAKDSRNKYYIGNRTFLFWASNTKQESKDVEEGFFAMLGNADDDDPNKNIDKVKKTMKSVWSGLTATSSDDRFYMLGLAPNSARIAVVYWNECSLKDFAGKILQHFDDMEIVDTRKEKKPYCGIYSLLSAVTLGGKSSDVQPNLPEALLKSIVQGIPYPASLYQACIRRIRAEQQLTITRAAIIKAYLNRLNDINHKKIEIMLDKQNNNPGYLCGRLFATLDKIQEDANHISSIRERYMNAASATPASVFSTLMNLSVHHSEKLNTGKQIYYEKLKQEILDKFNADGFPSHLDLQDQGRFFVGYYHQRQDFFTSKEISTEE